MVSGLIFKSLAYYELILVYFIPKYFIYFYAIINAIIFLISFTVCIEMQLFFSMLYSATFLNLLVLILFGGVFRVLHIYDYIICKQIILLLPF